jgi:hypothetical protein
MDTPGGMRPSSSGKMHPSDSTVEIERDMSQNDRLVYWEMGRKGFPESGLMLALEPQMCPPKVLHVQVWKMHPS